MCDAFQQLLAQLVCVTGGLGRSVDFSVYCMFFHNTRQEKRIIVNEPSQL